MQWPRNTWPVPFRTTLNKAITMPRLPARPKPVRLLSLLLFPALLLDRRVLRRPAWTASRTTSFQSKARLSRRSGKSTTRPGRRREVTEASVATSNRAMLSVATTTTRNSLPITRTSPSRTWRSSKTTLMSVSAAFIFTPFLLLYLFRAFTFKCDILSVAGLSMRCRHYWCCSFFWPQLTDMSQLPVSQPASVQASVSAIESIRIQPVSSAPTSQPVSECVASSIPSAATTPTSSKSLATSNGSLSTDVSNTDSSEKKWVQLRAT